MQETFALLTGLSPVLQFLMFAVVSTVFLIIFKDQIAVKIFGRSGVEEAVKEKTSKDWFDDIAELFLRQHENLANNHFAHLNEKVQELVNLTKETNGRISALQECIKKANNTLGEFKEYGIKPREV